MSPRQNVLRSSGDWWGVGGFERERGSKGKRAGKTQLFEQVATSATERESMGKNKWRSWSLFLSSVFFGKNSKCYQRLAGDHTSETPELGEIKLILKLDLRQSYLCWCSEGEETKAFVWWNGISYSSMQSVSSRHRESGTLGVANSRADEQSAQTGAHPGSGR